MGTGRKGYASVHRMQVDAAKSLAEHMTRRHRRRAQPVATNPEKRTTPAWTPVKPCAFCMYNRRNENLQNKGSGQGRIAQPTGRV